MAINEQPPKQPTGDAAGYACTAQQDLIAFTNKSRSGAFANPNPNASAEAYNSTYYALIEAAAAEEKMGCDPNSNTPNPAYEKDHKAIEGLEEFSKAGKTIKLKPDGSWDLSDPDTMAAAVQIGKETVRLNDAEANKNKPPDESKSGSEGGGGGGSGGGSGGGGPGSLTPQEPAKDDAEKEAAKQKCLDTINQLNSAIGNAYIALNRDAQILAEPSMAALGSINAGAIDACTKASQLQDVLNRVVAAGQAVATGGQGGAVQTETVNPITGNVVKQTAWYDPKTGDCVTQTDTLSNTGAASSVVATTKPTGQTTAVNVPPAGNPNTTVDPKTGKTQSGLTPAGASNATNWGNLLFWGAVGLVGVTLLNGGGGKRR